MKRFTFSTAVSALGAMSLAVAVTAQTPPTQTPTQRPQTADQAPPSAMAGQAQEITLSGCVQREADYRAAKDAGKGGAAGTGVGAGNEFVLVSASPSRSGGTAGTAGTAGSAAAARDTAYELTGPNEGQASTFVGKRVEIIGKLKPAETSATGRPTGGATAAEPPRGVDVTSKDLKLRELEVTSIREGQGSCSMQ